MERKSIGINSDLYDKLEKDMRRNNLTSFPELFNYYLKLSTGYLKSDKRYDEIC